MISIYYNSVMCVHMYIRYVMYLLQSDFTYVSKHWYGAIKKRSKMMQFLIIIILCKYGISEHKFGLISDFILP